MRISRLIKVVSTIYFVAAFAYFMYSLITRTGLSGLVVGVLLDRFGEADLNLVALITGVILFLPGSIVFGILQRITGGSPQPRVAQAKPYSPLKTWLRLFVIAVVVTGGSIAAYFILNRINLEDQTRPIYQLNLDRTPTLPAGDVKFIAITGTLQFDYAYQLQTTTDSSTTTENFVPLTAKGWSRSQPVQYFINTSLTGIRDPNGLGFVAFPDQGPFAGVFEGQLTQNVLPTFVAQKYEQAGLKIAAPHYVLDHRPFVQGKVADTSVPYIVIPIAGGVFGIVLLLFGTIGIFVRGLRGNRR